MILKSGVAVGPPNRIFPSGLMVSAMQKPNTSTAVSAKSPGSGRCQILRRNCRKEQREAGEDDDQSGAQEENRIVNIQPGDLDIVLPDLVIGFVDKKGFFVLGNQV